MEIVKLQVEFYYEPKISFTWQPGPMTQPSETPEIKDNDDDHIDLDFGNDNDNTCENDDDDDNDYEKMVMTTIEDENGEDTTFWAEGELAS